MLTTSTLFLISAVFTGSFAFALMIGGFMAFQEFNPSDKRKLSIIELADGFLLSSFFTAIFRVIANWDEKKEGRLFIYFGVILTLVTIVLIHFVKFG